MMDLFKPRRFFLAEYAVDFRKGHCGLLSEPRRLGLEPYAGDLVVFVSRDPRKIKAILGDETGLTLIYKIFSKGTLRTKMRFIADPTVSDISYAEVLMILEGSSYTLHKRADKWLPNLLHK